MSKILLPPFFRPIVGQDGILTEEMRVYFDELAARVPSHGIGSPEGVVDGRIGATYYDLDASAGSRHYIKINADISGDTTQGWELA